MVGLAFDDGATLVVFLHPEDGYVLLDGPLAAGSFTPLRGLSIGRVIAPPDERQLEVELAGRRGGVRQRLVFELPANRRNAILVDSTDDRAQAVLSVRVAGRRPVRPGSTYERRSGARRFAQAPPTVTEWRDVLGGVPPDALRGFLLREIAYTSAINVDYVLGEGTTEREATRLEHAHTRYASLRADPGAEGWLVPRKWGRQPYPFSLFDPGATSAASLLAAMRLAFDDARPGITERAVGSGEDAGRVERLRVLDRGTDLDRAAVIDALERRARHLERRRAALERELRRGPDAAELQSIGDLILARLNEVRRGDSVARVRDFEGRERDIELDPRLAPAANAERYYQQAGRRRRAEADLPARIARLDSKIRRVREQAVRVADDAGRDPSLLEASWRLAGGRHERTRRQPRRSPSLPYRTYASSGGLEIRVGRGARHNDALTFHHSAPEDIWLHARQSKGAHVILRWGRADANPPQRDLLEAAVAAAVHSEARHSGTVAVDWTRRKYVRKPRKAAPGAVTPDRVTTLFVEPDEDLLRGLGRSGDDPALSAEA